MSEYNINGKKIKFNPHKFEGKKSKEHYENQIHTTLKKIGITKDYIKITYNTEDEHKFAQVCWQINNTEYAFKCQTQKTNTQNIGAISQAIQEDIRQIKRGIKNLNTIMNQYKQETKKQAKKNTLVGFAENTTSSHEAFPVDELKLPKIKPTDKLNPEYNYLTKLSNEKLNILYLNFKNECINQNKPNHPMLKALMIVRHNRGLDK